MAEVETYGQRKKHGHEWKRTNPVAGYAEIRKKVQNYRTPDALSVILRLSMRLRSCSKANVFGGVEVFIGGGPAAVGGAEDECFFAATEAGTKDIIDVAGFLAEAAALMAFAGGDLIPGPLALVFIGYEPDWGS
jgi:hypothetical protein